MSSLFSLEPSASEVGVVIPAGFKRKEVICRGGKIYRKPQPTYQQNRDDGREASCRWAESISLWAACKRFTITALIRFNSS